MRKLIAMTESPISRSDADRRLYVPLSKAMASWYEWPRTKHSVKPDAFYDLVEQVSTGPYLELFSRRTRMGWDHWGDEAVNSISMPRVA